MLVLFTSMCESDTVKANINFGLERGYIRWKKQFS